VAKRDASASRPAQRKFTVNAPSPRMTGSVFDARSTHSSTSGGLAETEHTADMVSPDGAPSRSRAVTTAAAPGTPAITSRNVSRSITA
jgi:hypothetical protein